MPRSLRILTARRGNAIPASPVKCCLAIAIAPSFCRSSSLTNGDWVPEGRADHLFAASRPAQIEARISDQDCEVVAATVTSSLGTRGAPSHVVLADNSCLADIVQNAELRLASCILLDDSWRSRRGLADLGRKGFACSEPQKLFLREFPESLQILNLRFQGVVGTVEPE